MEGSGNAPPLKSCRYRFTYDDARVTACTTSEPIAVLAPSQGPASPVIGQQSGSWVELRSPDGEVLFHRRVHEAFGPYHEVTRGRIEDGEFDVIVPELSDVAGAEIVVASSEIGPGAGLRAATRSSALGCRTCPSSRRRTGSDPSRRPSSAPHVRTGTSGSWS